MKFEKLTFPDLSFFHQIHDLSLILQFSQVLNPVITLLIIATDTVLKWSAVVD